MRITFRAAVIVGLLALATIFIRPASAAGPATKIIIDPAAPSITADGTQTFKVLAVAADGTSTDVTGQSTVSANDPTGTVAGATYTPGKAGSWTVQAVYQSFTATAAVTVTPGAVKEIAVNPNSDPEQSYIGTNVQFTATVYDTKNNIISGQTAIWSVLGENGTINSAGIFVPKKAGTSKVQAAIGDVTGTVSVVVSAPVVTNTNTSAIVTNTAKTNVKISNTNSSNTNVADADTANTNTAITETTEATTKSCTSLKPWAWVLMLIIFLLIVAVLYALVPVTQIWPAVAALAVAAALAFIQRKYSCGDQAWWAWVVTLGTVALTATALQMRPKNTPPV